MERIITKELLKWKIDSQRKPILLYGITGSGKTYTTIDFGEKEYKNTIYFDCLNNLELDYVFEKNNTLDKLIRGLCALSLETIFKDESLIIFDNVNKIVIDSVKKLFVNSNYHVIMITSSKEVFAKNKGIELNMKILNLVNFEEYLKYVGKEQLIDFIKDSFKNDKPMPFHSLAFELYNDYVLTGGYPNSIITFNETKNYNLLLLYHEKNMRLIKTTFLMDNAMLDVKKCNEVIDNVSFQLMKENKKFVYGLIKPGGRAKEYTSTINYLCDNGLLIRSYKINKLESPLSKIKDVESFKLYYNDSGLLYKKMNVNNNKLLINEKLLENVYENNIVSMLYCNGFNLYYYHSDGKCEVDFVIQTRTGKIIPIELLHSNTKTKSKSLTLTMNKYNSSLAIRIGYDNFGKQKNIKLIPYYAAFCINGGM